MKLFLSFVVLILCFNIAVIGQTDTLEFCGKNFIAPSGCEASGNMIKCNDYVFTWTYEPVTDIPRHQKELLAQIKKPKKINLSVLNNDIIGYLSKTGVFNTLLIVDKVNEQGIIINLWLNNTIKTTSDLPEFIRQYITIKN